MGCLEAIRDVSRKKITTTSLEVLFWRGWPTREPTGLQIPIHIYIYISLNFPGSVCYGEVARTEYGIFRKVLVISVVTLVYILRFLFLLHSSFHRYSVRGVLLSFLSLKCIFLHTLHWKTLHSIFAVFFIYLLQKLIKCVSFWKQLRHFPSLRWMFQPFRSGVLLPGDDGKTVPKKPCNPCHSHVFVLLPPAPLKFHLISPVFCFFNCL